MRMLVTGATGFVGACLTRKLLELGHEVHVFVRPESNRWRIADLAHELILHDVDLRDAQTVEREVTAIKPEGIFHLATYGGFSFQQNVEAIYAANFLGTINLVTACEKTGFTCFVNTGSSSEYGLKMQPMKESDLLEPLGDYAVSKAAATLFCRSEAIQKNLPIINVRIFSPYGPWDDPQRLIPYVMSSLLNGKAPALSNPASVRDYIYIDDVIDAYLAVLGSNVVPGAIYNVGSGRQTNIGNVVSKISSRIDNGVLPVWGTRDIQRPEPSSWTADITALASRYSWNPKVDLDNGLASTITWMSENLSSYTQVAA